jgi:hypothetical protein
MTESNTKEKYCSTKEKQRQKTGAASNERGNTDTKAG